MHKCPPMTAANGGETVASRSLISRVLQQQPRYHGISLHSRSSLHSCLLWLRLGKAPKLEPYPLIYVFITDLSRDILLTWAKTVLARPCHRSWWIGEKCQKEMGDRTAQMAPFVSPIFSTTLSDTLHQPVHQ